MASRIRECQAKQSIMRRFGERPELTPIGE
jgi:hypothetical protein